MPSFCQQHSPMHSKLSLINPFVSRPCSIPFLLLLLQTGSVERTILIRLVRKKSKDKKEKT